ncbi:peptidoglycan D,D-transpeptidase FtsI family protein [Calidifontibacillus oryziterrae]|uniref:peptidoglycan D,D-transpeptidase FtsI family protein n=1 Tax=Calidifontibacillus oryziterrae TaxID=1191699 RepID=UPI0003005B67|nr:penicillin-binding protein 2 [Calidifontibacillus oryziterrae]
MLSIKLKRRARAVVTIVLLVLIGLIARLAQIQLFTTEDFSKHHINLIEASVKQRTQSIILDSGRGRFIDKNDEPITGDYYPSLVLFPFLNDTTWPSKQIASIIGVSEHTLINAVKNANAPFAFGGENPIKLTKQQQEKINELKVPGVFALYQQVKTEQFIGEHLIGLVRQNDQLLKKKYGEKLERGLISANTEIGITGLQKAFDEFLLPEGESKLLYHVDQLGEPLFGLNVKYTAPANPYYPTAIKTTINKSIQLLADETVDHFDMKKGGLVLLDVETSDVVAMVSRPRINHKNPLGDEGGKNQMIEPQIPGSIFKVVTALAAIEENVKLGGRTFNCDLNLYGDGLDKRQLGVLNFEQSFANSCNYTFAKLAEDLISRNPDFFEEYANKLGLIEAVGWQGDVFHFQNFYQFPEEQSGQIWLNDHDKKVKKAINQTAIGQKDVKISPLSVANMMATIARGGKAKQVRAVSEIQYKNGTTLYSFPNQALGDERLSPYSVMKIKDLLEHVISEGTGMRYKNLPYQLAGKSGTAETGRDGIVNKWFAGYFPAHAPKYALVVVELEADEYNTHTYDIFEKLVKELYKLHNENGNSLK